jgi:hypothetical protein
MTMRIELSDQQAQQVREGRTVEVVDPATRQAFVLLARDQYEQVRPLVEQETGSRPADATSAIPPGILRSQQAFWAELPDLLNNKRNHGRWVCNHGAERVGIGKTQVELYQECFRRGLARGQFYVGKIENGDTPPWGTVVVDRSLVFPRPSPAFPGFPRPPFYAIIFMAKHQGEQPCIRPKS